MTAIKCVHRDSNPNLNLGRVKYYPCTMNARVKRERAWKPGRGRRGSPDLGRWLTASIAQLAEHALSKRKVASSILAGGCPSHVRHGVVGNISACHADARGSIPRAGAYFCFFFLDNKKICKKAKPARGPCIRQAPSETSGHWRNRKRACFASTRYWDRNPDAPFFEGYWRNRKRATLARSRYWDRNPDTPLKEIRMV